MFRLESLDRSEEDNELSDPLILVSATLAFLATELSMAGIIAVSLNGAKQSASSHRMPEPELCQLHGHFKGR